MEARLKTTEFDCRKRSFFTKLRKEESRDCVVPDTMPDVAEVLGCWGTLLIRSKEAAAGRIRIEANIPAGVLCRGEDGNLLIVDVSVPVFLSADAESIAEGAAACAEMKMLNLEARTLNPRKILVTAEISAEISAYEEDKCRWTQGVEGAEHIHCHFSTETVNPVVAVTEKTFAVTDELSVPECAVGADNFCFTSCCCMADEIKSVGTKLVVKGRVKSSIAVLSGGKLCAFETVTDFSQIIELHQEAASGMCRVWLMPSGVYCSLAPDNTARLNVEYHLVAQAVCHGELEMRFVDDAYSNLREIRWESAELKGMTAEVLPPQRETVRQLFETLRGVENVVFSSCSVGDAVFDGDKMLLPVKMLALCEGGSELWREKRSFEVSLRVPKGEGEKLCLAAELKDIMLLPVPGGLELRLEAYALPGVCR